MLSYNGSLWVHIISEAFLSLFSILSSRSLFEEGRDLVLITDEVTCWSLYCVGLHKLREKPGDPTSRLE